MFAKKLDPILQAYLDNYMLAGFAVGVLKDDEVVYAKGFGIRDISTREPVTEKSLFHMASVSKVFVAAAVMQLVERGKIELDAPLSKYLPYFKADERWPKKATIRMMLNHTSGLESTGGYSWSEPVYDDGAIERYVRNLEDKNVPWEPGTKWAYSNLAFDVFSDVVAKVSGMTFEEYVKKNVLDPLGMKESTFLKTEVSNELATSPHVKKALFSMELKKSEIYPYHRAHAGSSTLHSSAMEMLRWAKAVIDGGAIDGARILEASTQEQMLTPNVAAGRDELRDKVGFSWFIGTHRGEVTAGHGGSDTGYKAQLILLPKRKMAVVTMGNSSTFPSAEVAKVALDVALGLEVEAPKPLVFEAVGKVLRDQGVEAAVAYYKKLKAEQPDRYNFGETMLDDLGDDLMDEGKIDESIKLYELNAEIFPDSHKAQAKLGDAYKKKGDKRLAEKSYRRALEIKPDQSDVKHALETLSR